MSPISRRSLLRSGLALSASSLVSHAAWARATALLAGHDDAAAAVLPALAPREKLLFDFGWKFQFGNSNDPAKDLGFGADQGDFAKTGDFDFAKTGYDDSKWRILNLPHDWAVELPFVRDEELKSHGYKPLRPPLSRYQRGLVPARIRHSGQRRGPAHQRWSSTAHFVTCLSSSTAASSAATITATCLSASIITDFLAVRREELHRRPSGRHFRGRLVLRGSGNLSARVAHQDRCAASGSMGKLRASRVNGRLRCPHALPLWFRTRAAT